MALKLYPDNHLLVDGENRPIRVDQAYVISHVAMSDAIQAVVDQQGDDIGLLPLSGSSGGAGVFQVESEKKIIGLHIQACAEPVVDKTTDVDIEQVELDQIIIDSANQWVYAGSAITLEQLNQALSSELGSQYRVLGADLTSYTYAQVGATFMTGGMGPQRRYFSDSVRQIALYNGSSTEVIEGDALLGFAGSYGWTGMVAAVCCRFTELPSNEIAFVIPVSNAPDKLAALLAHLAPFTQLNVESGSVVTSKVGTDIIMGLEHITAGAMQPFLDSGNSDLTRRTEQLKANCIAAGVDSLIFVNGFSYQEIDDFLFTLVDDIEADNYAIAGIDLAHTEVFKDADQMRAVREAIPYAARMQAPTGAYSFKGHTDATIRLNPEYVEASMRCLWQANEQYVGAVQEYFDQTEAVRGEILIYGHLNPVGVDPHNRITFACDDESIYHDAIDYLEAQMAVFIRQLAKLCEASGSEFIGGEKSAGSDYEILPIFGQLESAPPLLRQKVSRQMACVRAASPLFNWRAMKPYI